MSPARPLEVGSYPTSAHTFDYPSGPSPVSPLLKPPCFFYSELSYAVTMSFTSYLYTLGLACYHVVYFNDLILANTNLSYLYLIL